MDFGKARYSRRPEKRRLRVNFADMKVESIRKGKQS